jgi:hypothetical protein
MQHGRRVHAMLAQLQQLCIIYSNLVQTMAAVAARRDRQRASEPRPQLLAPSMESACVHAQLYGRAAALARPCSRPLATRLSFARPSPRWVLQCLLGQSRGGTNSQLKPSCLALAHEWVRHTAVHVLESLNISYMNMSLYLSRGQRSSPPPATLTKHKKTHHICCASRTADAMGF